MGRSNARACQPARHASRQAGFTLIEVLVTLVVLSLGLLGLAALQSHSMKTTHSAYLHSQAALYAHDMLDRMRANREAAKTGAYDLALGDATPACDNLVNCDRAEWRADLASLPAGTGSITFDPATQQVTIVVQWNDERAGGEASTQISIQSQL